jgi:hypothetical protein
LQSIPKLRVVSLDSLTIISFSVAYAESISWNSDVKMTVWYYLWVTPNSARIAWSIAGIQGLQSCRDSGNRWRSLHRLICRIFLEFVLKTRIGCRRYLHLESFLRRGTSPAEFDKSSSI